MNSPRILEECELVLPGLERAAEAGLAYLEGVGLREDLGQILASPAPSGSCLLRGGAGRAVLNLLEQRCGGLIRSNLANSDGIGVFFGEVRDQVDILLVAHMDRPGYYATAESDSAGLVRLIPCCAHRFRNTSDNCAASAVRFNGDTARLVQVASGRLVIEPNHSAPQFRVETGEIRPGDSVLLDEPLRFDGDRLSASGLDDGVGVLVSLALSIALSSLQEELLQARTSILVYFSVREEWTPSAFFGIGASRLGFAIPAPQLGAIVLDTHSAEEDSPIRLGSGVSYGFVSGNGAGSAVPLNYRALLTSLVRDLNSRHPHSAQANYGYFSRSDDFSLMRWARVIGLFGVPTANIHRGREVSAVSDLLGAFRVLLYYSTFLACGSARMRARFGIDL